jgi:hypothetical protein
LNIFAGDNPENMTLNNVKNNSTVDLKNPNSRVIG